VFLSYTKGGEAEGLGGPTGVSPMHSLDTPSRTILGCFFRVVPCKGEVSNYRGTSITIERTPLEPHRRPMLKVLGWFYGVDYFLMGKVPLHQVASSILRSCMSLITTIC